MTGARPRRRRRARQSPLRHLRSWPAPAPLPPPPEPTGSPVLRLTPAARRGRLAATGVVLALFLAGTLFGNDDECPFGPFRMYSTRADPNAPVISTRTVAVTATGEEVGLRRAEFQGQLDRVQENPELLGLLAEAFAERHPSAPELVTVQVVQRQIELVDGRQTGTRTDRVLVEYALEEGNR